jgi:hypothetical protein
MPGFVFFDGPSLIDGAPIVGIAVLSSVNGKTGNMVQTYILRADQAPLDAIRAGDDESICGDCVHRPALGGSCYVDVSKSVTSVFSAWVRGSYPLLAPAAAADMVAGRMVRMGAYGDPAAILRAFGARCCAALRVGQGTRTSGAARTRRVCDRWPWLAWIPFPNVTWRARSAGVRSGSGLRIRRSARERSFAPRQMKVETVGSVFRAARVTARSGVACRLASRS